MLPVAEVLRLVLLDLVYLEQVVARVVQTHLFLEGWVVVAQAHRTILQPPGHLIPVVEVVALMVQTEALKQENQAGLDYFADLPATTHVCGKCAAMMPCSFGNPVARLEAATR